MEVSAISTNSTLRCIMLTNLQVLANILAVGYPLDLSWGGQVHGLAQVGKAEGPGYPHVCQRKVVYI